MNYLSISNKHLSYCFIRDMLYIMKLCTVLLFIITCLLNKNNLILKKNKNNLILKKNEVRIN